jgi:hypothetical protein
MTNINKQFIYLSGILALAIAATFAVTAQETGDGILNIGAANNTSRNLSTMNGQPIAVASISEIAGNAPVSNAGASSARVSGNKAGSFKIGTSVGGTDPFDPEHVEIETLKLGIPIKSMRDTGKMFFVCDIV